jgi:hypothetical protein
VARATLLAALTLLVGCGGGGSSSLPPTNGASTVTPFSVTVGTGSSVTKIGIASSAESGSPEHDFSVAAGSSGCSASGSARVCTANIALPTGAQTLTVTTYGATTAHATLRMSLAGSRVALAVDTTIAQISLDLAAAQLVGGQSGTTTLYVTARDANGNTIVGTFGGPSIVVTSTDTTNSVTLSPATITAGGTPVTVSYNGSGSVSSVTFNATSSGVASSAIVPATLTFTSSQVMYTTSGNSILVFAAGATGDTPPIQQITVPGYQYVDSAQPDGQGNLWVQLSQPPITNGNVYVYGDIPAVVSASATGVGTPTLFGSSALPPQTGTIGMGVDGSGNAYYLVENLSQQYSIYVFAPGQYNAPLRTITPAVLASPAGCSGIDVGSDGTVVVKCFDQSQSADIYVFGPGASGSTTPMRTITGTSTTLHPYEAGNAGGYVAIAADGTIVASDYDASDNTALLAFAPGASGNVAPARRIAGAGTSLDAISLQVIGGGHGLSFGIGINTADQIFVGQYGSQSVATGQILIFGPTATGAVPPAAVLGGPLTGLGTAYESIHFAKGVVPVTSGATSSVSGDMLDLVANRSWNYTMTPASNGGATPSPPVTMSLYVNPSPVDGDTELLAYEVPGVQTTALLAQGAVLAADALFTQGAGGGWAAEGYVPVSDGTSVGGFIPIPGGIGITRGTFTLGQTFDPYLGLTGSVVSIGAVPGSSACPGGAANGAIVAYTFAQTTETVGYVPGCGITYFVSDAGATAILTSVSSSVSVPTSSVRAPASRDAVRSLRSLWQTVFTPWRPR